MTTPARTDPIAVGEQAPDFTLPTIRNDGSQYDLTLSEVLPKGPVLLVFYEDDGMPICTSELKAFAQEYELLARAGVQVFGMNTNGIGSHTKFQERDHYPFDLISDFFGDAIKAFGLWDPDERKSRRAVVIVGTDGRISYVQPHFNPGNLNGYEDVFRSLGLTEQS